MAIPPRDPPKLETLEQLWLDYFTSIWKGVKTHESQRIETKRAFVAGLYAMFGVMKDLGDERVDSSDAEKHLDQLELDCQAFYREVKTGRA